MKNYLLNSTPKPSKEIQNLLLEPYFPHSAPAKNQVRQLRRTFRLNQNENSLCPVDMSLDDNQSWRLPASPTRHKISYDNRSRFKAPITIHKKSIQPDFSFLNESLHEENSAANRTPERSINYLNRICEKLIEEQSEIKQQITQQKKTIN